MFSPTLLAFQQQAQPQILRPRYGPAAGSQPERVSPIHLLGLLWQQSLAASVGQQQLLGSIEAARMRMNHAQCSSTSMGPPVSSVHSLQGSAPRGTPGLDKATFLAPRAVPQFLLSTPTAAITASMAALLAVCMPSSPAFRSDAAYNQLPRPAEAPWTRDEGDHAHLLQAADATAAQPVPAATGLGILSSCRTQQIAREGAALGARRAAQSPFLSPGSDGATPRRNPGTERFPWMVSESVNRAAVAAAEAAGSAADREALRVSLPVVRGTKRKGRPPTGRQRVSLGGAGKGVTWSDASQKWRAQCWEGDKVRCIGYSDDPEKAALAHAAASSKARGPGAKSGVGSIGMYSDHEPKTENSYHTSKYKGVSWAARSHKWRVQLWFSGKVHHLGFFVDEEAAARAYDRAVVALRGPAAFTNFPLTAREATLARQSHNMRNLAAENPDTRESAECLRERVLSAAAPEPGERPEPDVEASLGLSPVGVGVGLGAGVQALPKGRSEEAAGRRPKRPYASRGALEHVPGKGGMQCDGIGAASAGTLEQPPVHMSLESRLEAAAAAALAARAAAAEAKSVI